MNFSVLICKVRVATSLIVGCFNEVVGGKGLAHAWESPVVTIRGTGQAGVDRGQLSQKAISSEEAVEHRVPSGVEDETQRPGFKFQFGTFLLSEPQCPHPAHGSATLPAGLP